MHFVRTKCLILLTLICLFSWQSIGYARVGLSKNVLRTRIQKQFDQIIRHSKTPGAVLLVDSPKTGMLQFATGYSNIGQHAARMKTTDSFRIASLTKTIVAALVMKLVDKDAISLDSKVKQYLPPNIEVDLIPNGDKVTIRQLLNMSSGIPDYTQSRKFISKVHSYPKHRWTALQTILHIYGQPSTNKAGRHWHYSNTNYNILQLVLENLSKHNLNTLLRAFIFKPLHMQHTFLEFAPNPPYRLTTHGYESSYTDNPLDITHINNGLGLADGGLVSTASDYNKFIQALFNKQTLLSKHSLKQMLDFNLGDYGLGVSIQHTHWGDAYEHSGATSGYSSNFIYIPKLKLSFILLTNNLDSRVFEETFEHVMSIITKKNKTSQHQDLSYYTSI